MTGNLPNQIHSRSHATDRIGGIQVLLAAGLFVITSWSVSGETAPPGAVELQAVVADHHHLQPDRDDELAERARHVDELAMELRRAVDEERHEDAEALEREIRLIRDEMASIERERADQGHEDARREMERRRHEVERELDEVRRRMERAIESGAREEAHELELYRDELRHEIAQIEEEFALYRMEREAEAREHRGELESAAEVWREIEARRHRLDDENLARDQHRVEQERLRLQHEIEQTRRRAEYAASTGNREDAVEARRHYEALAHELEMLGRHESLMRDEGRLRRLERAGRADEAEELARDLERRHLELERADHERADAELRHERARLERAMDELSHHREIAANEGRRDEVRALDARREAIERELVRLDHERGMRDLERDAHRLEELGRVREAGELWRRIEAERDEMRHGEFGNERGELERLELMSIAADHLREAGAHDLADLVMREIEERRDAANDRNQWRGDSGDHERSERVLHRLEELMREVQELRHEVHRLQDERQRDRDEP